MLQFIRDRATGWIAWGIMILLIIPFALWGIYDYFGPNVNMAVAQVNGQDIGYRMFQNHYQRQRYQLQSLLGANFDINLPDERIIRQRVLDRLIDEEALMQVASDRGLAVGDEQLLTAIRAQSIFQTNGIFSRAQYESWLRNNGFSPTGFESELRRTIVTEQIRLAVADSRLLTASQKARVHKLTNQRRSYAKMILPWSDFRPEAIGDTEVKKYFEENKTLFISPEQVQLEYIALSKDNITAQIEADEDTLREIYERQKLSYVQEEQREASHILVRVNSDEDEAAWVEAEDKLQETLAAYRDGASFEDLAREHSEDPGSASSGGSLGYFGKGIMDPSFEAAAFSLDEGEVSEPVRSSFGVHLIKVTSIDSGSTKTFEEVRDQILVDYKNQEAEQLYLEQADTLANLSFEHPESLEVAAEALGLVPEMTGYFDRQSETPQEKPEENIESNPRIVEAAFSAQVLEEGANSDPIELDNTVVVVRVNDHRLSAAQTLDEVRDRIREELSREAAGKAAREAGEKIIAQLQNGDDRVVVAADAGYPWEEPDPIDRNATGEAEEVREAVFRMPKPVSGSSSYELLTNTDGDTVLLMLISVGEAPQPDKDSATQAPSGALGDQLYTSFVRVLRDTADVDINRQLLDDGG